ncbi:MAG: Uncharacterised protein [Porticoccaceae bacterium UBA1117]|nr:MAG: Uncharacterised protein [Porticoccaceae bacterium UBA1117]
MLLFSGSGEKLLKTDIRMAAKTNQTTIFFAKSFNFHSSLVGFKAFSHQIHFPRPGS